MKVTVLSGGVGGAKFCAGLAQVIPQKEITVIVNTGDDFINYGLYVSPDVDIVLYTLAGRVDLNKGWGIAGDSFHVMSALAALGEDTWFQLGDKDLAIQFLRTKLRGQGVAMHQIARLLAEKLGVTAKILPMTDQLVQSIILSQGVRLPFQEYMVHRHCADCVNGVEFEHITSAVPAPGVMEGILEADIIILAPSNPFVSIGAILTLPGIRQALCQTKAKIAAISPIVQGKALKGPAGKMLKDAGLQVSPVAVCSLYADFIDLFIADRRDSALVDQFQETGIPVYFTDTIMCNSAAKAHLATAVIHRLLAVTGTCNFTETLVQ